MQNTSNEIFVLCKIMFTVQHTSYFSTKQDLEITQKFSLPLKLAFLKEKASAHLV